MKTTAAAFAAILMLSACAAREGYMTPIGVIDPGKAGQQEIDDAKEGIDQNTDANGNTINNPYIAA